MIPQSSCVGVVYSDASDTGFGGYLVKCRKHEVAGSCDIRQLSFRACSHEPGSVSYPGVMIAPGQASPRVHMMIC